ncbi:coiled-coil domain-containing protein [Wolbachia endosymbiont of Ctenocephalides felis wCfeT]|uniref:hypothetical protein n=1 Tax=Wolbachia endosymbiont of Ctenocephalides felis wCfeT TaxID=2732593 RepID=UPI00144717AB|nr:hypothetical protein [Wolbachia endosymbiont of Ctenocephalides felis wCfeT]
MAITNPTNSSIFSGTASYISSSKPVTFIKNSLFPKKSNKGGKVSNKLTTEDKNIIADVISAMESLLQRNSADKEKFDREKLKKLASLRSRIESSLTKDRAIMKFCHSIIENEDLCKAFNDLSEKNNDKEFSAKLDEIIEEFGIHQLQRKMLLLKKIQGKSDFNSIKNSYGDWGFYNLLRDLTRDENFKKEYLDKAFSERSKSFMDDVNKYIELAYIGRGVANKYFSAKLDIQAYYSVTGDNNRVLNINLVDHGNNEPIEVSDILKKEQDTDALNIYHNGKLEVYGRQDKEKKRYYTFEGNASYEMTSTWPVSCKMVMHVNKDGIAKVLSFDDGTDSKLTQEKWFELLKQNQELYIQGLPLHEAVAKYLGLRSGETLQATTKAEKQLPDVIPTSQKSKEIAKSSSCEGPTKKGPGGNPKDSDKDKDPGPDSGASPAASSPSTPDSQPETVSQPGKVTTQNSTTNVTQQAEAHTETKGVNSQSIVTQAETTLQDELNGKIVELSGKNSGLQSKLKVQEQKFIEKEEYEELVKLLFKESEELKRELDDTEEKKEKLNRKFEQVIQTNEELTGEVKRLFGKNSDLENELKVQETGKEEYRELVNKLIEARSKLEKDLNTATKEKNEFEGKVEELSGKNSDLQAELEAQEQGLKAERIKGHEELMKVNTERKKQVHGLVEATWKLRKALSNAIKERNAFEDESKKLKIKLKEDEEELDLILDKHSNTVDKLNSQLCEKDDEIKDLEERVKEQQLKLLEKGDELNKLVESYKEIIKEKFQLLQQEKDNKIEDLESQLQGKDNEIENLKEIIEDKTERIERMKEDSLIDKKEIKELRNYVEDLNKTDDNKIDIDEVFSNVTSYRDLCTIVSGLGGLIEPITEQLSPRSKRPRFGSITTDDGFDSESDRGSDIDDDRGSYGGKSDNRPNSAINSSWIENVSIQPGGKIKSRQGMLKR